MTLNVSIYSRSLLMIKMDVKVHHQTAELLMPLAKIVVSRLIGLLTCLALCTQTSKTIECWTMHTNVSVNPSQRIGRPLKGIGRRNQDYRRPTQNSSRLYCIVIAELFPANVTNLILSP